MFGVIDPWATPTSNKIYSRGATTSSGARWSSSISIRYNDGLDQWRKTAKELTAEFVAEGGRHGLRLPDAQSHPRRARLPDAERRRGPADAGVPEAGALAQPSGAAGPSRTTFPLDVRVQQSRAGSQLGVRKRICLDSVPVAGSAIFPPHLTLSAPGQHLQS